MTPQNLLNLAIVPALRLLPDGMDTMPARAMLVAIALQETDLRHRRQVPSGPGRGYWQFERQGAVAGVLSHAKVRAHAHYVTAVLDYSVQVGVVYEAIEHNDVLAAAMARLLLWTVPRALPTADDVDDAWSQYLEAWRPSPTHRAASRRRWPQRYERAWKEVTP